MKHRSSNGRIAEAASLAGAPLALALAINAAHSGVDLYTSVLMGRLINSIPLGIAAVLSGAAWLAASMVASMLLLMLGKLIASRAVIAAELRLRERIGESIHRAYYQCLENRASGDLLSRTMQDIGTLSSAFRNLVVWRYTHLIAAFIGIAVCLGYSWRLTLVSFACIPLIIAFQVACTKPVERAALQRRREGGAASGVALNILQGIETIKAFNLEDFMNRRYYDALKRSIRHENRATQVTALTAPLGFLAGFLPFAAMFGYGSFLAIRGEITIGDFFTFASSFNFITNGLMEIQATIIELRDASGASSRILEVLDLPKERDTSHAEARDASAGGASAHSPTVSAPEPLGSISCRSLSFSYLPGTRVLSDIDLEIEAGETLGFAGPSGGGKSTLLKLLAGLYRVEEGELSVCGLRSGPENLDELREQVSVVAQDSFLFPLSLRENLVFGRPGASQAAIEEACARAEIHEFIESLPAGYETKAGERGSYLSGGQRQRVCIARAFLRDAPILILDEPTASLDAENEEKLQEALGSLMAGRTTIIVSHRLATLRRADRIVCLERGKISAIGSHAELMASSGLYRSLFQEQSRTPA
jgi:ABC-type multidrug transport system, ATPase and permease components